MYRLCTDADATITSTHWVRQNPWDTDYPLDFVRITGKIYIPHTHAADVNAQELQKALCIANAPIGTIVVVAGKRQALLVRLTSDCTRGPLTPLAYTADPYTVFLNTDAARILPAVAAGRAVQPFAALWRRVKVIGEVAPSTVADCLGSAGTKLSYFQKHV